MKLLQASFLLAAATATQLQATDFTLTYAAKAGSIESNASATGTIGIDTSLIPNPGSYDIGDAFGFSRTPVVPPHGSLHLH